MAALPFKVSTGNIGITSTSKTLMTLVAPANQRVKIVGISISGQGISNTDTPPKFELITFTSMSGGTSTNSNTITKEDGSLGETIQTGIAGVYSAEPTYTGAATPSMDTQNVHPQSYFYVKDRFNPLFILKGGTGFAVRATSNQSETFNVTVFCEE